MSKTIQSTNPHSEEEVSINTYYLVQKLGPEEMAALLSDFCNQGAKGYATGVQVGKTLTREHRTLQRLVITMAFGILVGISEQAYSDARNAEALASALKVKQLLEEGQLPLGLYL